MVPASGVLLKCRSSDSETRSELPSYHDGRCVTGEDGPSMPLIESIGEQETSVSGRS